MRDYKELYGDLVDGSFPGILAKNASGQEAADGTPYTADILNDLWGFMQALMSRAGKTPNGEMEKAGASQIADSLYASKFVKTAMLDDLAATSAKLAPDAVTTAKIADASVTSAKLASNAVATAKIADASVTSAKLASNAVATAKIAGSAVTQDKIAASARSFHGTTFPSYSCMCAIKKTAETAMVLTGTYTGIFVYAVSQTSSGMGGSSTSESVRFEYVESLLNPQIGAGHKGIFLGRRDS